MIWEVMEMHGRNDIAQVAVLASRERPPGYWVECADTRDPRYPRSEKWCVILSSQFGCPVRCTLCDAGSEYRGDLSAEEILGQVDWAMERHRLDGGWACPKIKVHFARMGEPSLNPAVLDALRALPGRYPGVRFLPVVATIAPVASASWFDALLRLKDEQYSGGAFQLQFSVNSTDEKVRDTIMPARKWTLRDIARFGERWWRPGDRKVTLNFALAERIPFDPETLTALMDPDRFLVKITPVNPTASTRKHGLKSMLSFEGCSPAGPLSEAATYLWHRGLEVLFSIGSPEEIRIGSNCGQLVWTRTQRWERFSGRPADA